MYTHSWALTHAHTHTYRATRIDPCAPQSVGLTVDPPAYVSFRGLRITGLSAQRGAVRHKEVTIPSLYNIYYRGFKQKLANCLLVIVTDATYV